MACLPENVKFTIADCSYTSVWEEVRYLSKRLVKIDCFPILWVMDWHIRKMASYNLKQADPIEKVKHAKEPLTAGLIRRIPFCTRDILKSLLKNIYPMTSKMCYLIYYRKL